MACFPENYRRENATMSKIALILAGHGSHISPNTAGIVWGYVDKLRQWGVADEITACFWKEEPSFSHVLDTICAETVVIVPVFTAQGYFTQTVLPTEMGLAGSITHKHGKTIYYTPTIGEHPYLETIVQDHVMDMLSSQNLKREETAVAIIGHGTRRNQRSQESTRHQANLIRQMNIVAEVVDVYLDDDPDIPSMYQSTHTPNVIAVPFFLAEGSHVTIDVPDALGIQYGKFPDIVQERNVYYTPPVGTGDAICRIIVELARDTGVPTYPIDNDANPPLQQTTQWSNFPMVGHDDFIQTIESNQPLTLGQVMVTDKKVWHVDDTGNTTVITSPEALRAFVREDPFRPLITSDDLPTGWHVDVENAYQAYAVVETIYPSLIVDWANHKNNIFLTESLEDIGTRQMGMFQNIHLLDSSPIQNAVENVCGRCTRQPSWLNGHNSDNLKLPCKTPCNVWLSTAKEMRDKQQ